MHMYVFPHSMCAAECFISGTLGDIKLVDLAEIWSARPAAARGRKVVLAAPGCFLMFSRTFGRRLEHASFCSAFRMCVAVIS
jgi:hypothetical protein